MGYFKPLRRKLGVVTLLFACVFATRCYFRSQPSRSIITRVSVTAEQREKLSPAVQRLLADIVAGTASGSVATDYLMALNEAIEVNEDGQRTHYWISLDGASEAESHPCIFVRVDKKDGCIKQCGTVEPCW